ncbi:Sir2 family transcriptional regulator (macronuclear) [Tetrahymena thermophila SB210]|uniref:Sir2 family transcriptional regulator n=1 Tax=Tetrahymena thermophila (strain SB210) TaxID=312017 RepID=Q23E36_TETTS|nr:Sir2 family transcriptional regulator [Tetrahymena thermophila SB210]EAR94751.2 Sir2 family transcriptional regulator [Tetrahymena thermophila SB210]|eukprot:XP_001014996.2 Sir2 family transcriptional regulator [Tetrahymena thermophila SB210]
MIDNQSVNQEGQNISYSCQISNCPISKNGNFNEGDIKFCTDCNKLICNTCITSHDENHTIIEGANFAFIQENMSKVLPNLGNLSPILQSNNLNISSDSKMISEDTLPDTEEKKVQEKQNFNYKQQPQFLQKINDDDDEDDDDSDSDDDDHIMKMKNFSNIAAQLKNLKNDSDEEEEDDEDDDEINFISQAASKLTTIGKVSNSPTNTMFVEYNTKPPSENQFDFNQQQQINNASYKQSGIMNGTNFLQVPQDFNNVKRIINQNSYQNNNYSININGANGYQNQEFNSNKLYQNQYALTELQKVFLQKEKYYNLVSQFYKQNKPNKNLVTKKIAAQQIKKKRKAKDDLGGDNENDESKNQEQEDIPIPQVQDHVKESNKKLGLQELKNRSKQLYEELKAKSDLIFKEIKHHIHGVQYERDETDRINKYKKYALEGIESYFLYLKDQFKIEYSKLKKCKKREQLSKMMNKVIDCIEKYQYYSDQKDFLEFMNKNYDYYLNNIELLLHEIQKEGNDFPPQYKIVYENLYDIFFSLISYISLNLPNQKTYSQFTQPIIKTQSSKYLVIPIHYPNKKIVGIFNCRSNELEQIEYDCSQTMDFQKYSNFQLVNDSDFIYFIGGVIFNKEKSTFNPSQKCFKMSRHSGEIIALKDMPYPKMKFGTIMIGNFIYVFGGLQTQEKHRTNTCEKYDINTNTWKILPVMQMNRVCPVVSSFTTIGSGFNQKQLIYLFGGMEDKNNINQSIEVFDQKLDIWIDFLQKPANSRCYIPKQLGYGVQINQEQILIIGGLSGRKQKPTSQTYVYNVSKNSICNLSLDSLPTGIIKDSFTGMPVVYDNSIFLLNTQISQYFPSLKQLQGVTNVIKIGLNQQEILATHCF